jgi:cytochrome b561
MTALTARMASAPGYKPAARFFHWATVLMLLVLVPAGVTMVNVGPGALQNTLYDLHRSLGVTIALLTIIRLMYRLMNPPPAMEASIAPIQQMAAHGLHWVLYAGLILLPIGGSLGAFLYGAPLNYFWLFKIAPPVAQDQELAKTILETHGLVSKIFGLLILAHIGAALMHHFVFKDRTLIKMVRG